MKHFSYLILLIVCINNQSCNNKLKAVAVNAVRLSYRIPIVNEEGILEEKQSSFNVFYYKDLCMYEFPYGFDSVENGKRILREFRHAYFVYQKDSAFGYSYDNRTESRDNIRLNVEDMVKSVSYQNSNLDTFAHRRPDSTFTSPYNKNIVDVYKMIDNIDSSQNCTIYLTYDKRFTKVEESLSRKIELQKKMKLIAVDIEYKDAYSNVLKIDLPARIVSYKLENLPVSPKDERFFYIKKYETEVQKNGLTN